MRPLNRVVDYFATEPVRVAACLRLPMIGLIALLVYEGHIRHWLPEVWTAVLLAYTAAALVWLVIVLRGPVPPWADWASTSIDVLAVFALCVASGAATMVDTCWCSGHFVGVRYGLRCRRPLELPPRSAISRPGSSTPSAMTPSGCRMGLTSTLDSWSG